MEAARPPAKRIAVGEVISEAFSIYRQNVGPLLGSSLAVFLVVGLVSGLAQNEGGVFLGILAGLIQLVAYPLYTGFVVRLVQDVRDGRRDHTVGDLFSAAAPAILPLIAFGIMSAIALFFGFLLLIIPGLILLTFWSVGPPAIIVERAGPFEAFGRSWHLVRGDAWSVFGVLLLNLLIVLGIGIALAAVATPIGNGEAATLVASIISNVITAPIFALAVSVLYFDLGGDAVPEAAPPAPAAPPPTFEPPPPPPPAAP